MRYSVSSAHAPQTLARHLTHHGRRCMCVLCQFVLCHVHAPHAAAARPRNPCISSNCWPGKQSSNGDARPTRSQPQAAHAVPYRRACRTASLRPCRAGALLPQFEPVFTGARFSSARRAFEVRHARAARTPSDQRSPRAVCTHFKACTFKWCAVVSRRSGCLRAFALTLARFVVARLTCLSPSGVEKDKRRLFQSMRTSVKQVEFAHTDRSIVTRANIPYQSSNVVDRTGPLPV